MSASVTCEKARVDQLYAKGLKLGVVSPNMSRSHFALQLQADEASASGVMWMMGYASTGKSTLKANGDYYRGSVQGRSGTDPNSFAWLPYLTDTN
jgi:hypothetical protein